MTRYLIIAYTSIADLIGLVMTKTKADCKAKIIAIGNQKGGVGKTTNTVQVATALGEGGKKCLIIDLDMNQGSTRHLGVPSESFMGTFEILTGQEKAKDLVISSEEGLDLPTNVHLIAARRNLEKIDQALAAKDKFFITQDVLIEPLKELVDDYDFIFLDTAPNATTPTIAAYKTADWFILSATPDPFAVAGLNDALTDIQGAQRHGNPGLRLLGVILSGFDSRTILANSLTDYVEQLFSDGNKSAKFNTVISRSTIVPQAQKLGRTIFQTAPKHKITQQYRKLAREIEKRLVDFEKSSQVKRPALVK